MIDVKIHLNGFLFNQKSNNLDDAIGIFFPETLPFDDGPLEGKVSCRTRYFHHSNGQCFIQKIIQWTNNNTNKKDWHQNYSQQ